MTKSAGGAIGKPDFGTYHHATPAASERLRDRIRAQFSEAFACLPFAPDAPLRILDIGCGLGFLSCVSAGHYPRATVTGFDTFEHASLKGSSLARATRNAETMGLSKRVRFETGDALSSDSSGRKFDLLVSNLVYHNLGKKRWGAYGTLAKWMAPSSYAVIGDIFFDFRADSKRLGELFRSVETRPRSGRDREYRLLVLSGPKRPRAGRTGRPHRGATSPPPLF